MVAILITSAKLATLGLLKIKVFWNKTLSCDSNYIADLAIWPKFGNSSISMREVIIISIL